MAHDPSTSRSWTEHYEPGVPHEVVPAAETVHDIWLSAAAGAPGRTALVAGNRRWRFAEVEALSSRVAAALVEAGSARGAPVVVALPPGLHLVVTALGVLRAGGVVVPVSPGAPPGEVEELVRALRPAAAVVSPEFAAAAVAARERSATTVVEARAADAAPLLLRSLRRLLRPRQSLRPPAPGALRWSKWLARRGLDVPLPLGAEDPAMAVLGPASAATSGNPLALSHRAICAGAAQIGAWLTDALPEADRWLLLAPFASPFGFAVGLGAAPQLRGELALLWPAGPADVLDGLRYLRPDYVFSEAEAVLSLLALPGLLGEDLRSVRAWLVAESLGSDAARQMEEIGGLSPCQGLCIPGAAGLVLCNPVNGLRVAGSLGVPMPGVDARIDGEGPAGRLEVRGPNVAPGGRWCETGVSVHRDAAGFFHRLET